ncbi:MAG: tetratricopeptide repeat protein [Caldilineaceae bacterium]|nr:tetratricopeptide repeat protein [Caldilineaceae bacterium]
MSNLNFEIKARCDLGLCHHLSGQQELALSELNRVLELVTTSGDLRYEAFTRTRLGYVYEAIGQHEDAKPMYERGRALHDQMGQHYYALNALAGSARIAELQGDDATAYAHTTTIWETIAGQEMDATIETARTLRTCCTIFLEHDDPRTADVLDMTLAQLRYRASTIDDPEHVEQFWQIDDHRFFHEIADARRI